MNPPEPFVGRVVTLFAVVGAPYNYLVRLLEAAQLEVISPAKYRELVSARKQKKRGFRTRIAKEEFVVANTSYLVVHFRISDPLAIREPVEGRLSKAAQTPAIAAYPDNPSAIERGQPGLSTLIGMAPGWIELVESS